MPTMRLAFAGLAINLAACASMRTRIVRGDKAEDPSWCRQIGDPRNCNPMQLKWCKSTCGTGEVQPPSLTTQPVSTNHVAKLPVVAVTEHTSPAMLTRVMKTSVYEKLWPLQCDGSNKHGAVVVGLNTNGFVCSEENGGQVGSIISPIWHLQHHVCWHGECVPRIRVDATPRTFWQAASIVAVAESFKVTTITTKSGVEVEVKVKKESTDVIESTGVHATVEVQMLESSLEFVPRLPDLTEKGLEFFQELEEPLGALISMQITAFPDNVMKVLFCAHGSTTRAKDEIHEDFQLLPQQRADSIALLLHEALPPAEIAELGDAIGHYAGETTGFAGSRDANIIYKIYDSTFGTPECQASDLWTFVK